MVRKQATFQNRWNSTFNRQGLGEWLWIRVGNFYRDNGLSPPHPLLEINPLPAIPHLRRTNSCSITWEILRDKAVRCKARNVKVTFTVSLELMMPPLERNHLTNACQSSCTGPRILEDATLSTKLTQNTIGLLVR
jgi:hypothetical protein